MNQPKRRRNWMPGPVSDRTVVAFLKNPLKEVMMRRLVLGAIAFSVLVACQPPDTSSEWQAIVDALSAAWNTGDFDGLGPVVAEGIVYRANPPAASAVGLDSLCTVIAAARTTYPDFHVEIQDLVAAGDRAAWQFVITGTHDSLGTQTRSTGMMLGRKTDGSLVEYLTSWDGLAWNLGLGYTLTLPSDSGG